MRLSNLSLPSLALAFGTVSAFATPIPITNGNSGATAVTPGVVTITNLGTVASTVVGATISGNPGNSGLPSTFTASYNEMVIRDGSNPFGAGDLTFVMTFTNLANSLDALHNATNGFASGFSNFLTDVGYVAGTGQVPLTAYENNGTIGFSFTGVNPGQSSVTFVIETNATNFANGTFSLIDSQTGTAQGFIPAAPLATTPEPSSLALLGTGILGVAGAVRRRFKK